MALRMSSVCRALPFLSTPKASEPFLPFALSRLLLTSTGLSYLTRLSTGGIILSRSARPPPFVRELPVEPLARGLDTTETICGDEIHRC